jgi:serine protease
VVTVAATNRSGGRASYSNYGSIVALAAPGGDSGSGNGIYSTLNAGSTTPGADSYAYYSGTSMATPHVAAVAALMYSVKPTATPDQITAALKSSARAFPATCSQCGTGILNADAALTAILGGGGGGGTTVPETTASNDTRATAQSISAPATISGSLSSTDTNDYFAVSLPAGKTLTASLPNASGVDYDLYLYNASGTTLKSSTLSAGQTDSFTYSNTTSAAATVYVRVLYYGGGAGSYSLTLGW